VRSSGLFRSRQDNGSLASFVDEEIKATLGEAPTGKWTPIEKVISIEDAQSIQRNLAASIVVQVWCRGSMPFDSSQGAFCALKPVLETMYFDVQAVCDDKKIDKRRVLRSFWETLNVKRSIDQATEQFYLILEPTSWFLCRPVGDGAPACCVDPSPEPVAPFKATFDCNSPLKPEFASLMCNLGKVRPRSLVLDPFTGTHRIAHAAEYIGALVVHSDIVGTPLVRNNIFSPCWRAGSEFDAIVTDPPFSRRERKFSSNNLAETGEDTSAHGRLVEAYKILDPLFDLAEHRLRVNGRLVFTFMNYPNLPNAPTPVWEDERLVSEKRLRLLQVIPQRWVKGKHIIERVVVVMEKI